MSTAVYHRTPDYGFSQGLDYTSQSFPDGAVAPHHVSREQLLALPNVGDDPERDAQVAEQMKSERIALGMGRAVGYVLFGPKDADKITFAGFGWGGNIAHPVAIGEAQALAASDSETQWLMINTPGVGGTEALPSAIAKELRQTGSYNSLGEHYVTAIADELKGREVHLRGHSLGGRTALGMTPHIEGGVESLAINDPTGSKPISLGALAHRFIATEGGHQAEYKKAGFDPFAAERQKMRAPRGSGDGWANLKQMFTIDPIALTRESFARDLQNALPNVHNELRVLSPELSALNNPSDIAEILGRVTSSTASDAFVEQWVLKGHTHSFMSVAPAVEALLYKSRSI